MSPDPNATPAPAPATNHPIAAAAGKVLEEIVQAALPAVIGLLQQSVLPAGTQILLSWLTNLFPKPSGGGS